MMLGTGLLRVATFVMALFFLGACVQGQLGALPNLDLDDSRPIFSVAVADADEAALVVQATEIEPLKIKDGRLFFHANEAALGELDSFEYTVADSNPYNFYVRTVRVPNSVSEKTLMEYGLLFLHREVDYQIVTGKLGAVRALARTGIRIGAIAKTEPRPRTIRIPIPTEAGLQRLKRLNFLINDVDLIIDQVRPTYVVFGEALDHQIKMIRDQGFTVSVIAP